MSLLDGFELCSPEDVYLGVVGYFENEAICRLPKEAEVREALETIPKNSSPSLDGFGSAFFLSCWNIVKGM